MKDLVEKLTFIKTEVLAKFNIGETSREWCVTGLLATEVVANGFALYNHNNAACPHLSHTTGQPLS